MSKNLLTIMSCILLLASCKQQNDQKRTYNVEKADEQIPKQKVDIKTVGILLYDGYAPLDAMGPYAVFSELMGSKVFFVGRHRGLIEDAKGMKVQVDSSIADVKQLDILLIPGGFKQTFEATKDKELLDWIKSIDSISTYTTSVCTGAWILGATGLLKDKEATTHWSSKKLLADLYGANVKSLRYTHSGKYWTSAGVTAGLDMSLALINEIKGEKYTK